MSDPTPSAPDAVAADLEIGLADFLPDGVAVAGAAASDRARAAGGAEAPDDGTEDAVPDHDTGDPIDADAPTAPVATVGAADDDEIDLSLLDAVEHDLGAVDAALAALDDGSYGTCAVCRTELAADVLAADPVRRTCPQHA